ncbi:hypothetical protein A4U98_01015 [Bifidobacterium animalis subsp. animalis]|nr:hypothetical protein A4U98_01015 [Bifidobacterium animalis subsp. animalis]PHQ53821.1 hypothetical protein ADH71_006270 [Bifidobacterium animalis subsp. animalis]
MRNLGNYTPAARTSHVHGMSDVFRAPDGVRDRGERWVKTSVSLRADTRMRLKRYAAAHDMKLQDVIDEALDAYLGKGL